MKYALSATALWGLSPIVLKHLVAATSAQFVTVAMYAIAALALAPWVIPSLMKLGGRAIVRLGICALLMTSTFNFVLAQVVDQVSGTTIAAIIALEPALILLISSLIARKAPRAGQIAALAMSIGGVLFLLQQNIGAVSGQSASAMVVIFLAALAWCIGVVMTGRLARTGSDLQMSMQLVFLGSLPFLPLVGSETVAAAAQLGRSGWLELLFLALLSTVAANVLWCLSIRRIGAQRTGGYVNLIPVVSIVSSQLILGESLTLPMVAALAVTLGGVYFFSKAGT